MQYIIHTGSFGSPSLVDANSLSFSLEVKWMKLRYSSKHVSEHMNVILLSANCIAE